MKVQVLVDNPKSWMVPHAQRLVESIRRAGHEGSYLEDPDAVAVGDVLVLLSCEKIMGKDRLSKNRHNLVVHESPLPQGRGWSPLTWQVLEGKNQIPVSLIEADERVDSGVVYAQETLHLEGTELVDEMRALQAQATERLVMRFLAAYPDVGGRPQDGTPSYYPRRRPADSELDLDRTLRQLIPQFRVADNQRYPCFFNFQGQRYTLHVHKREGTENQ